jgi:anthranilate phosphoribosyltransferase
VILHALDGYDEISLTGGVKAITHHNEAIYQPEDMGLSKVKPEQLYGGESVAEAAKIFEDVLSYKGTKAQNEAIFANAGWAISVGKDIGLLDGIQEARESLQSGKALQSFKKFLEINHS